ncbi:MAG: hypothetical protein ACFNQC_05635, partial [Veillonella parvula]
ICYGDFNTDGQQDVALMIDYKGVGDITYPDNTPFLAIFHSYEPNKDDHILNFNSYDGIYSFTYTIFYPSFLSAEEVQKLRNMIEFFDSTNNPSFKMQEHVLFPEA